MKILVFSWRGPGHPLAGGAEQVDHEHHKGWIAAGHDVTLFTSSFPGAKAEEVVDSVKIMRLGNQYIVFVYAFFWYVFGKHDEFDLVVDEFHGWPFFTPLYVRKPKLAVIQEVTKEVWLKYPLPYGLQYLVGPLGYLLEPLFFLPYRNIKFMIGSESAKEELAKFGITKKNIVVVPHGVLLDIPKNLPHRESKKTIVFLGALAKDKGIEDAIATFGLLARRGDFQFWVIGKGDKDYVKFLRKLAQNEGIEKRTTFFGYVSDRKKFELLSKTWVMINPSIREGWGLVNIEANAVATPIVAYNSPGLVDSVCDGESGIIIERNDPEHLADAVANLLESKDKYKKLSKGALNWSRSFSWKKSIQHSLTLINRIARVSTV